MGSTYDDLELGPSIILYKIKKGSPVPAVGDIIPTRNGDVMVTESSSEEGYLKVVMHKPKPLAKRFAEHKTEVEAAMEHIAEMIYERTSEGLTSKIGWIGLPDDLKARYYELSYDIVMHLDVKKLLVLPYE